MSARKRPPTKRAIRAAVENEVAPLRAAVDVAAAEINSLPTSGDLDPFCPGGRRTQHFAWAASMVEHTSHADIRREFRRRAIEALLANTPRAIGRAS